MQRLERGKTNKKNNINRKNTEKKSDKISHKDINNTNKSYRDSVFTDLFYEDEHVKENELALYNALFNTNYTLNQVKIEKIRIDDVVYMKLKNDVSFNVNNQIIVFLRASKHHKRKHAAARFVIHSKNL